MTTFKVQTTASYKNTGIYSATRDDATQSITVNWGDGTVEQVDGDISQKVHEYATVGEFEVSVYNIKSFAASSSNDTWCNTTSQNAYTLKEVVLGTHITSVGNYAFFNCTGLTDITIPSSVTSIGNEAFRNCIGLTGVTIPNSVTSIGVHAFSGCSGLTSVDIPNGVTSIGNYVFNGCTRLSSITIPNSVTSISEGMFNICGGLVSITIPNSVTTIGDGAFRNCTGLTNVTIGNSVTSIGMSAFSNCTGLTSVTIPNSVTSIGYYAFEKCSGLTSITIGNGVTSIGEYVFWQCTGLTSVTIGNSVTSIETGAFYNCTGLTSVTIPNSVTSIGTNAFYQCTGLTSVTIPNSVTSIGSGAFSGCSGLTSISIPNSATSIGSQAFYNCTGLTDVTIPNGVTSIGEQAFRYCTHLTSVTLPSSVTSIGQRVFQNCTGLAELDCSGCAQVPALSNANALYNTNASLRIIIPDALYNDWVDATNWSAHASRVVKASYASSTTISVVRTDGTESTFSTPTLTKTYLEQTIGNPSTIESISIDGGIILTSEPIFESTVNLAQITFIGRTTHFINATKILNWSIGMAEDGTTHLVVIYLDDGVIVVGDGDGSSGESGIKIDWDRFSEMLESRHITSTDPVPIGTSILVPYKVDPNGEPVDTEWVVIGYNKGVPEYVKYMNGDSRIYVSSVASGLLAPIGVGDNVYTEHNGTYTAVGTVSSVGSGSYSYGNNNPYTVPDTVTYNGTVYGFAGNTATLMSKYALGAKYGGELYHYPQFNHENRNDWSSSDMRGWLNGSSAIYGQAWNTATWSSTATGTIVGLTGRLTDQDFMKHVSPAVNPTWVHSSWRSGKTLDSNGCEHVIDRFWLLDIAAVNCKGQNTSNYYPDAGATVSGDSKGYAISRYDDVFDETDAFTPSKPRKFRWMKEDGTRGSSCWWWLRSADSNGSGNVGGVYSDGLVYNYYADYYVCCVPACLIQ